MSWAHQSSNPEGAREVLGSQDWCSPRGPSQGSQPPGTPASWVLMPSSGLCSHCTCVHTQTPMHNYNYKRTFKATRKSVSELQKWVNKKIERHVSLAGKKLEPSFSAGGNVKLSNHPFWEAIWQFLQNLKHRHVKWLNISTLRSVPRIIEHMCTQKSAHIYPSASSLMQAKGQRENRVKPLFTDG